AAGVELTKAAATGAPDLTDHGKRAITVGSGLISDHGTDASSPVQDAQASARASDLTPESATDWLHRMSSVLVPTDSHPVGQKAPGQPATTPAPLLETGERLLREGNVVAARPLLKRAADAGNADAAFDLGMSFDPSFLTDDNKGAVADPVKAAIWYRRALK